MRAKARQRNVEPARLSGGAFRCRNTDDSEPLRDPLAEPFDDKIRGRTGTETENHAILDEIEGAIGGGAFQFFAIHVMFHRTIHHQASPRAARSTNQTSSPTGETWAEGNSRSPART